MTHRVNRSGWMIAVAFLLALTSAELFAQRSGLPPGGMNRWIWAGRLPVVTVEGTIITDSLAGQPGRNTPRARTIYYLDTTGTGERDLVLFFGPPGYRPANGAQFPMNGDTVTVRGGLDTTTTPQVLAVYAINGTEWRDTTGAPAWGHWLRHNSTDTTFLISNTDSLSRAVFPPGVLGTGPMGGGMMWPDSVFAFMAEFFADTLFDPTFGHIFTGFHFGIFGPDGLSLMHGGMMGPDSSAFGLMTFMQPIRIQFHIPLDSLIGWNTPLSMFRIHFFDRDSTWKQITNVVVDSMANTITVTDTVLASFYVISAAVAVSVEPIDNAVPEEFTLQQNYPNPFNPSTTIEFAIPQSSRVTLEIFDQLGRRVTTLMSGELPAGSYRTQWNAAGLASGVYHYRLTAPGFTQTKSLMLLK